jgi:hypothetical protein
MAAVQCHIVYVRPTPVDSTGTPFTKDQTSTTIKKMMTANTEMRIVPDPQVPNSANTPDIKTYVQAEAAAGWVVRYMDNTIIITYPSGV